MSDEICDERPRESGLDRLLAVMAKLRSPNGGCPWDLEQTFATIAPYTIEEAYEVADAIERRDMHGLREELGDLLLQVAFHSRMAEEIGAFDFDAVANGIADKMIERHPHVFGDHSDTRSAHEQTAAWETLKSEKRALKGASSAMDDIALALPALTRAEKMAKRAARTGFDWPTPELVLDKVHEELAEIEEARASGDQSSIEDEIGDLLFTVANLARKLDVDPEAALRAANRKFERRFRILETLRAPDRTYSLQDLEALWRAAKVSNG
jgi:MazG family protein